MTQVKVVELNAAVSKPSLPPILQTVRHSARKRLAELVQGLFDGTDDALFELADRSESDQQQEMYFDSMRHVRLNRKVIAESFLSRFKQAFDTMLAPGQDKTAELDPDSYELVEQDELEMTVAVAGIVSKITSLHSLPIMQLTRRLDALLPAAEVSERNNPLGPHQIASAFAESLGGLEVSIRVRIIIMKLFERFVMERIGSVYEQANSQLIDAGVLPELKRTLAKPASPSAPRSSGAGRTSMLGSETPRSAPSADPLNDSSAVSFSAVQSLLAKSRSSDTAGSQNVGISANALASRELITALTDIQTAANEQPLNINTAPVPVDVGSLLRNARQDASLSQGDDDAVNFVGMLFDYILNDRNLAIPMKALISRLQIPVVKVAIVDKTFFEKSLHPARSLLNELSSAGIGWSSAKELKRDAMYDKIEAVVHAILQKFTDDPQVFRDQLDQFRNYVAKESRRSVLVEQRVKDTEQGKARTQHAKSLVQSVINQKASGLRLPKEVGHFVSEAWSRVLTLQVVKFGEDSDQWRDNVAMLDDLLWMLQPLSDADDIDKRDQLLPSVCQAIEAGMNQIGSPVDEINNLLQWLCEHLEKLSANDRAFLTDDDLPPIAEETPTEVLNEIVLTEVAPPTPPVPEEFEARIREVTEGSWVEIKQEDESTTRCKLATVTQPAGNYVFVNRRGMKVAEKNRLELAGLFKDDRISVIDESQVFDRALRSVIGNLREMQRKQH